MHRALLHSRGVMVASAAAALAAAQPSSSVLAQHAYAAAVSAQATRAMSSKREKSGGMPERKAGRQGYTLPDDDQTEKGGRRRFKSTHQREEDESAEERAAFRAGEGMTRKEKAEAAEYMKHGEDDPHGTQEERDIVKATRADFAQHMMAREPLRKGEQSWRERQLVRSGIPQQADFKAERTAELLAREAQGKLRSSANALNPVLIRTRAHLNPADLPPSFDHFAVPALSAAEVDAKEKALHASYWSKYAAWKDARPEEYQKWLARLQKREAEQDYHWVQSQIEAAQRKNAAKGRTVEEEVEAIKEEAVKELLPEKHRVGFDAAVAKDPALAEAVSKLGKEEVLRRWSAYQVFLDAELTASNRQSLAESRRSNRVRKEIAMSKEDAVFTINEGNYSLEQRKSIYRQMLGAKRRVTEVPFWTDPDPSMEGEHDWKMADAFVKPPLLPPRSHLRAYAARTDTSGNFSSLHRFLHFERLRQTISFLREHKKTLVRANIRSIRDVDGHFDSLLASQPEAWEHIRKTYPFLSDALLSGMQSLHLTNWTHKDQQDFLTALHRNVMLIGKLLDSHFSRRNRNAAWILPYPRLPKDNPDEVLRAMSARDIRKMESQVLGEQMLRQLQEQPEMVEKLEKQLEADEAKEKKRQEIAAAIAAREQMPKTQE